MKEKILQLRSEGKTYNEIVDIVGCSKSTISYHCGDGQKEKSINRKKQNRKKQHPILRKIENFKARKSLKNKTEKFQCRVSKNNFLKENGSCYTSMKNIEINFYPNDVINKFGIDPKCCLSGRQIDWEDGSTYELDHIIPVSLGGDNSLENLQILNKEINRAKCNLTDEEFLQLCKEVLEYQGYKVEKLPRFDSNK